MLLQTAHGLPARFFLFPKKDEHFKLDAVVAKK